jgi:Ulp1 family protease
MHGTFVNDNIVDFWMSWITWKEIARESSVHIFTTHFYTTLRDKGYDAVAKWTVNKEINIFKKKMILIPVNQDKHWSLCAIINAGYIDYNGVQLYAEAFQVPVLVHLDSLNLHSMTEISNNIKTWLNAEYSREKNCQDSTIFNNITIHNVVLQGKVIFIWILLLLLNYLFVSHICHVNPFLIYSSCSGKWRRLCAFCLSLCFCNVLPSGC